MTQIQDFPDYYIDNEQNIWSNKFNKWKKLKPILNNRGYLYVVLCLNGQRKLIRIHQIVAKIFISNPENYPLIRHLDDNKLNNKIENLAWGTDQDNVNDKIKNGNCLKGEKHNSSKLTEKQVIEIRKKYIPIKYSTRKLAKEYNVHQMTIQHIINNKTWNHL